MAQRRYAAQRRQYYNTSSYRSAYVYGNAVRQPEVLPRREEPTKERRTSVRVRRNRRQALFMNWTYVAFLGLAMCMTIFACVFYLQMRTDVINQSRNVASLQQELTELTQDNDTSYHAIVDTINLDDIRNRAMNEMGMVYSSEGQVIEYTSPTTDTVKQYEEIPKDGILAKSKNYTKENRW